MTHRHALRRQQQNDQEHVLAAVDRTMDAVDEGVRVVWDDLMRIVFAAKPHNALTASVHAENVTRQLLGAISSRMQTRLVAMGEKAHDLSVRTLVDRLPTPYLDFLRARVGLKEKRTTAPAYWKHIFPPPSLATVNQIVYDPVGRFNWQDRFAQFTKLASPAEVASLIQMGALQGLTPQQIAAQLKSLLGDVQISARRVARTVGMHVAHTIQMNAYDQLGEMNEGYQIHATEDKNTRPEHRARDGREYHKDPSKGPYSVLKMPRPPLEDDGSVAHNCFVPETEIQGRVVAGLKAFYSGHIVELVTRSGLRLRVTPNHPVCTPSGFVAARFLSEGDTLLRHGGQIDAGPVEVANEQYAPARIDQVFKSLRSAFPVRKKGASPFDFHGDGDLCKGDVEVVGANGFLGLDPKTGQLESRDEIGFERSHLARTGLEFEADSPANSGRSRVDLTASGRVRSGDLTGSPIGRQTGPLDSLRIGPASQIDASRHEYPVESGGSLVPSGRMAPTDSQFARDLLHRYVGLVAVDDLVEVRYHDFSGHVYDLQTDGGWLVANGIICSNCRCYLTVILCSLERLDELAPLPPLA